MYSLLHIFENKNPNTYAKVAITGDCQNTGCRRSLLINATSIGVAKEILLRLLATPIMLVALITDFVAFPLF